MIWINVVRFYVYGFQNISFFLRATGQLESKYSNICVVGKKTVKDVVGITRCISNHR